MSDERGLEAALVAAQAEMPKVRASGHNPHFHSTYVTLDDLLAAALPVLNRHGLALSQFPISENGGQPALLTILMHESGGTLQYVTPLLVGKQDMQALGSAITYARRYALASALGIAEGEDDDGNRAVASEKPEPEPEPAPDAPTDSHSLHVADLIVELRELDPETDWRAWCLAYTGGKTWTQLDKIGAERLIAGLMEKVDELRPTSPDSA